MMLPNSRRPALATAAGLWLAILSGLSPALAVKPDEILADPALEGRARSLSAELRCLVCQNQSIDDSDADLARDLRLLVRDRLKAGDSDAAIKDFLVARYGEYVLLKPRFEAGTLLLWLTGPAALLLGAGAIVLARRKPRPSADGRLTPEEEARIEAQLASGTGRREP